eukprot:g5554.t1
MKLTSIFNWCKRKVDDEPAFEFTEQNCGLSLEQVRLGRYTMKVLGLQQSSSELLIQHHHHLTQTDLLYLSYAVGMNPPEYLIEAKLRILGISKLSTYTFEHFLHLWRILLEGQYEEEIILERAFNFFDKDGNGEISASEFKTTMTQLGNLLSETEVDEFLGLMDVNRDGVIDHSEFIRLIRDQRPMYMDLANRSSEEEPNICPSSDIPSFFKQSNFVNLVHKSRPDSSPQEGQDQSPRELESG